jgi:hypothetical protein
MSICKIQKQEMVPGNMMKKKMRALHIKIVLLGLPVVGAMGASLLPLRMASRQFLMLIIFIWFQTVFLFECRET